jgi:hypothetical protein
VLDLPLASGGFVIGVPIPYQTSLRMEIDPPPGAWVYYQLDGFDLPPGTIVGSFDGTTTPAHDGALDEARRIWADHDHPGDVEVIAAGTASPGAPVVHAIGGGPGVVTAIRFDVPQAQRAEARARITVDGVVAADAPLAWLTGSVAPAGAYTSAFTAADATSAWLYAPIPFQGNVEIEIASTGGAIAAGGDAVVWRGDPGADVGRFAAVCEESIADIPAPGICDTDMDLGWPNVSVAHVAGTAGQYVGQTMYAFVPAVWWCGLEPDHEISIDGAPALLGTGTEDYFGGAFYFRNGPYTSPLAGATGWDRRADGSSLTHLYRHHVWGGVPFESELSFEYEIYLDGTIWSGCSFFYLFDRS